MRNNSIYRISFYPPYFFTSKKARITENSNKLTTSKIRYAIEHAFPDYAFTTFTINNKLVINKLRNRFKNLLRKSPEKISGVLFDQTDLTKPIFSPIRPFIYRRSRIS